jgi:uncharacterized NAD(P)/FAD-binding protein YdhS/predicted metal-dependent enzyme (double-stranded beta helix superfamily)
MHEFVGRLGSLVRQLDGLGQEALLVRLTRAIEAAQLTVADVASYVKETAGSYHRSLVVRRDHYELLILTWLPGQGSVPHDHAGSISAMQVLQGEAAEGCWRIAADGYADLEYETIVGCGEMTAWQDAGLHTVRNSSADGQALITVHVYAPPLKDFRRYITRPPTMKPRRREQESRVPTIAIVGGGFSGSMTAAQILRRAAAANVEVKVALVERRGAIGEGLAYGTRDPSHLLNVPAGRMSAWSDKPDDFVDWVSQRHGQTSAKDFLPRQWYGEYVRETLLNTAIEADESAQLSVTIDEVRRIARRPLGGWMVHFANHASLAADAVVLAIGHRPPSDPLGKLWRGSRARFIADPWQPFVTNAVRPDEPVVILGTGLTAFDAVLSLSKTPRHAPITLLSRRGLIPETHAAAPIPPADLKALVAELLAEPRGVRVKSLFHLVRNKVRDATAAGHDWRSVVDGLRPHTAALWHAMPLCERQKFLARLRPYWEVHRHRMALDIAVKIQALVDRGLVRIMAGSVSAAHADEDAVRLFVRERGQDRLVEVHAGWVLNCTGPTACNSAESNPVIGSLLVHGWVQPDELGLGLETTADGNAIDAHGRCSPDLFVVGTLRKPALWESTAVPELRGQAAAVADATLKHLAQPQRMTTVG